VAATRVQCNRDVVLCADLTGLGAIHSLSGAGVPTVAACFGEHKPALRSRYPERIVIPWSHDRETCLLRTLSEMPGGPDLLIRTSDYFVHFVAANGERLFGRFGLCVPSDELIELMLDKALETGRVSSVGIPMPITFKELPEDPEKLAECELKSQ
jgi:hypothetical protein